MVYGPIQGGPYGACQETYPVIPEGDLCGDCGQRARAQGDWLCQDCRRALNEALRRAALGTDGDALLLAWASAEMRRQLAEAEPDDDELPF